MNADGRSPNHVEAAFFGDGAGFSIEVVEHFHVIGNKSDRHYDRGDAGLQTPQYIADVGLQPRLPRRTTAALIYQLPPADADAF